MLFWSLLAVMTGAAAFSVLWPLSFRRTTPISTGAADIAVYRDQLSEIGADRARGLIAVSEAEAARAEVARRLIEASNKASTKDFSENSIARRRIAAMIALFGVPAAALLLYLSFGSPELPSTTAADRAAQLAHGNVALLITRVENHLAEKPDDGRGWELLAPIYLRLGRTNDAVKARESALRLLGETAERQSDLGEALVANANGVVTADARAAFDRAAALDNKQLKTRFFLGLAAAQDGQKEKAEKIWRDLVESAPADAPYLPAVRAGLDRLKSEAGEAK